MRLWICKCGWRNPAYVSYCRGCGRNWMRAMETHADGRPSPKTRKRRPTKEGQTMQDKTRGAVIDETRRIRTEDVQGHEDPETTPPPSPQGDDETKPADSGDADSGASER